MVNLFTNLNPSKSEKIDKVDLAAVPQNLPPIVLTKCIVCSIGGMVELTVKTTEIVIYDRIGLKLAKHKKFNCLNKNKEHCCRVREAT